MSQLRVLLAACRLQFAETRRQPAHLLILLTTPLYSAMFVSIARAADSDRALVAAVFAPAMISLWFMAVDLGGSVISDERGQATLEPLIATPSGLWLVVLGRVMAIVAVASLTFAESYAVATLLSGATIGITHPVLLVATIVVTLLAMSGTAAALSGLFVLARSTLVFQNFLTYPFYVLGGVLVPVALLPDWVHPLSRVIFLSWSSDLIRDSTATPDVSGWAARLLVVLALGAVTLVIGVVMIRRVSLRVRMTGSASYA